MSFIQKGNQDYTFGFDDAGAAAIAAACGMKPQTLSITKEPEFQAEAENSEGLVESRVIGPDKISFTMSGYIVDKALFDAASDFTYDGNFFVIGGRKIDTANRDYKKGEMSGTSNSLITS
jgi:hypothetical protein